MDSFYLNIGIVFIVSGMGIYAGWILQKKKQAAADKQFDRTMRMLADKVDREKENV